MEHLKVFWPKLGCCWNGLSIVLPAVLWSGRPANEQVLWEGLNHAQK
jgi:hypothetical protein